MEMGREMWGGGGGEAYLIQSDREGGAMEAIYFLQAVALGEWYIAHIRAVHVLGLQGQRHCSIRLQSSRA